jgi:hypothetical protein
MDRFDHVFLEVGLDYPVELKKVLRNFLQLIILEAKYRAQLFQVSQASG